jgi:hypothetical protein
MKEDTHILLTVLLCSHEYLGLPGSRDTKASTEDAFYSVCFRSLKWSFYSTEFPIHSDGEDRVEAQRGVSP